MDAAVVDLALGAAAADLALGGGGGRPCSKHKPTTSTPPGKPLILSPYLLSISIALTLSLPLVDPSSMASLATMAH